jgi:hypothetical protein
MTDVVSHREDADAQRARDWLPFDVRLRGSVPRVGAQKTVALPKRIRGEGVDVGEKQLHDMWWRNSVRLQAEFPNLLRLDFKSQHFAERVVDAPKY